MNNSNLRYMKSIPIGCFSVQDNGRSLVAEASDICSLKDMMGVGGKPNPLAQQIYNDACDIGIEVQGVRCSFRFALNENRDDTHFSGTTKWTYTPIAEHAAKCPVKRVVIFND